MDEAEFKKLRGIKLIEYLTKHLDLTDFISCDKTVIFCIKCWWRSELQDYDTVEGYTNMSCPKCSYNPIYFIRAGEDSLPFFIEIAKKNRIKAITVLNKII